MNEEPNKHGFSEHHQRHVRTTFQYIDKLLSETEHTMADAGSPSPFRRHSDDTTPIQRKVTHDYIVGIREAMRRVMEELNISPPEPHSGAVWAAGINLMYSSISLNELTPERMLAYGPLSSEAAERLDRIRAELDGLVGKLRSFLGRGAGGDLQQRLQQLGKTSDEIRLLGEIERIVTAHVLVEFRGTLSMLLDRMESAAFEVGVFGRVSSGKSSLLNYILQTDVLPIGVTPVTAIPTRISHGPVALRCDLGIVLTDASEGLTQDDLIVVQALYQAGASAMILIGKADLFSAADQEQMISYVKTNLHNQLGVRSPVHAVSVFGTDAALCDSWFESELRPFLAQHQQLAIISQKRKIGGLRESVIGVLERRLQAEAVHGGSSTLPDEKRETLREADRVLERAQGESFFLTRKITKMHRAIIDVAAERIAAGLIDSDHATAASIFSETLASLIAEPVACHPAVD
jgi:hypothetical protein